MQEKVLMKGNEALAEAAILAGCRHYFGYPITPQTEVAAYMSKKMPKIGSDVVAPDGSGVVISVNMLTYNVKVKIESKDGTLLYKDYKLDQLKSIKANTEDEKLTKEELEAAKALKEGE